MSGVGPLSFGIGPVVLNYVIEQNLSLNNSNIWCFDNKMCLDNIINSYNIEKNRIKIFPLFGPRFLSFSPSMELFALSSTADKYDVVHQHGLWTGVSRVSTILRIRHSLPSIISPHGSIEKWALQRSKVKKRLALFLYEKNNLNAASCLHACSHKEVAGVRDFGLSNPVAVIPNGIGDSWLQSEGNSSVFRKKFNIPESKRILLYLSRITPIKGLPMLMEALGSIRRHLSDWVLVLAGADEFGHLKEVRKAVTDHSLQDDVIFTGLLKDQLKRDAFSAADLFILPTLHEAAPVVVLEALGAGVPVITTKGAPWEDLLTHNCGWWTEISSEAIATALQAAIEKSPTELMIMGKRGRDLVASRYTWKRSAQMTIELYEWVLNRRERPAFVVVD